MSDIIDITAFRSPAAPEEDGRQALLARLTQVKEQIARLDLEEPEDIVFVTASGHPFVGRDSLDLDLVIDQPFILTERNASYRFILDQYLAAQGKEIHPFLEIGNTEFIISLLRKNLGVSFLPEFTIHQDIINGELAVLDVRDFYMRTWRQIVYHKDKWVTREMDAFLRLAT